MISPKWVLKEPDQAALPDSCQALPRLVQHLLRLRGEWSEDGVHQFLNPRLKTLSDPFDLGEMAEVVARVFKAVDDGESIALLGDYDVDGITSVTLLSLVLKQYGVTPHTVIPQRGKEGYGLTNAVADRVVKESPETTLLIAMDCGTSSLDEVKKVSAAGIEVIILDHHESNTGIRPECHAIVNPKAKFTPNKQGDFSYLCAAGVVFKLCHALMKTRMLSSLDLKDLLDLVAIATVADIVPLVGENRVLVRHGLKALGVTQKPGVMQLKEIAGVGENPQSEDIGFKIGPRINAAGRMDAPLEAFEILTTDCHETAEFLVSRLNRYNQDRQSYEKTILEEAMAMVEEGQLDQDHCIILAKRGWHPGVVGIVSARIMRRFFKPTFVVAIDDEGQGKGSGRSLNGLSLVNAIESGRDLLSAGGGHHAAAGISICETQIPTFNERVNDYFRTETTEEERSPKIRIDVEVDFQELSMQLLDSYEQLKPFGASNPQPIFMSKNVVHARPPRELKNNHLKLSLAQKGEMRDAIFFGGGALDLPPQPWDICYTVDKNVFRGRTSLQITIQHVRAAQ